MHCVSLNQLKGFDSPAGDKAATLKRGNLRHEPPQTGYHSTATEIAQSSPKCGPTEGTMANEQNLTPFTSDQSREAAAINGRKGGLASGKAKREHKTIAQMLRKVLDEALPGDPQKTRGEALVEAIAGRTFKGGKATDLKVLAEILGEQVQRVEHSGIPNPVVVASQETADHLDNLRNKGKDKK